MLLARSMPTYRMAMDLSFPNPRAPSCQWPLHRGVGTGKFLPYQALNPCRASHASARFLPLRGHLVRGRRRPGARHPLPLYGLSKPQGLGVRVTVPARVDNFRLVRGTPKVYFKVGDSGNRRVQGFCGECGSPICTHAAEEQPKTYGLRVGCIRERQALTPRKRIWCRSALEWSTDLRGMGGTRARMSRCRRSKSPETSPSE